MNRSRPSPSRTSRSRSSCARCPAACSRRSRSRSWRSRWRRCGSLRPISSGWRRNTPHPPRGGRAASPRVGRGGRGGVRPIRARRAAQRRARRTAALRVEPPARDLEVKLTQSISPAGEVLDSASKDLARARAHVREARKHVMDRLGAILGGLDQTDRAPDAAVTLRGGRYVIPIRSTARSRVGGIVHDESATRSTLFVEPPEIIELGNELRAAEAAEQREVLRVLRELTDLLRPHAATIAAGFEMCIAFDDLCARAKYAVEVNGFVPEIGGHVKIRTGRHPLLDHPVPFDLDLHPDEFTILVSGPNTGGKTVLIKAVGLP